MSGGWDFRRLTTLAVLGLAILSLGPLFGYYLASPYPSAAALSQQSVISLPPYPDQFQSARDQYQEKVMLLKARRAARFAAQPSDRSSPADAATAGASAQQVGRVPR